MFGVDGNGCRPGARSGSRDRGWVSWGVAVAMSAGFAGAVQAGYVRSNERVSLALVMMNGAFESAYVSSAGESLHTRSDLSRADSWRSLGSHLFHGSPVQARWDEVATGAATSSVIVQFRTLDGSDLFPADQFVNGQAPVFFRWHTGLTDALGLSDEARLASAEYRLSRNGGTTFFASGDAGLSLAWRWDGRDSGTRQGRVGASVNFLEVEYRLVPGPGGVAIGVLAAAVMARRRRA